MGFGQILRFYNENTKGSLKNLRKFARFSDVTKKYKGIPKENVIFGQIFTFYKGNTKGSLKKSAL